MLVDRVSPDGIRLTLVNTGLVEPREVLVQAGAFGEHSFTMASRGSKPHPSMAVTCWCGSSPEGADQADLGMKLNAGRPTYDFPWE